MPLLKLLAPPVLLVALLLVAPLPFAPLQKRWPLLLLDAEDATHILLFAGLAWIMFRALRQRAPRLGNAAYPLTFLAVTGFGLAMEIVQAQVNRDPAWIDLANDAAGALGALLLIRGRELRAGGGRRGTARLLVALGVAVLLVAALPLCRTIAAYAYRAALAPVVWREDSWLLQRFVERYDGQRPALLVREVPLNRKGYGTLEVHLRNLSDRPLRLVVRVHGKRFRRLGAELIRSPVTLQPHEARVVRFSRGQILATPKGHAIDLKATCSLIVAQQTVAEWPQFRVEQLRLAAYGETT